MAVMLLTHAFIPHESCNLHNKPAVALQLSTKKVITMEWIEGCKVNDQAALLQASIRPQDVAVLLLDAFAEMTYVHGFVHGDPHPGNILVRPVPNQGPATKLLSLLSPLDPFLTLSTSSLAPLISRVLRCINSLVCQTGPTLLADAAPKPLYVYGLVITPVLVCRS